MLLRPSNRTWPLLATLASLLLAGAALAQSGSGNTADLEIDTGEKFDVDFLFNYYDQDGERSPVTGGLGTENQQVIAPVIQVRWKKSDKWSLNTTFGIDQITSASTDNIDDEVSTASRLDTRSHAIVGMTRTLGGQSFGFDVGVSKEYDYQSISAGLSWSREFNQRNTAIFASLRHYADDVDIYPIDGTRDSGSGNGIDDDDSGSGGKPGVSDQRNTTDFSIGITQVLGRKTLATVELSHSSQSGFLSTSFHEVILQDGTRVAERLPDSRSRSALGLRLNHSFSRRMVLRTYYRYYDDDWGISAHTLEIEPHFKIGQKRNAWWFPILRFHTQDGSDFFGKPFTFTAADSFFTADGDISEFDSQKFGIGFRTSLDGGPGWLGPLRRLETRVTFYDRDDGLEALSVSYGLGWSF